MRRSLEYWNKKRMSPSNGVTNREFILAVKARREAERKEEEFNQENQER
tara:strand:+ start:2351 stop:2497 length:147 start_codon:yes stop_codon:yes gene_type:complete